MDAQNVEVLSVGRTGESEQNMRRLVELANMAPSVTAAVNARFDEILKQT